MLVKHKCVCHVCNKEHEYINRDSWESPLGSNEEGRMYIACDEEHHPNEVRKAYNRMSGNNLPMMVEYNGKWLEPELVELLKSKNARLN